MTEVLIEMFRVRPVLAAETLDDQLHVPVPGASWRIS